MSESIIIALIGIVPTVIMAVVSIYNTNKTMKSEIKADIEVLKTEIKNLKDSVNKHNQIVERTYKCEADIKELQAKIGG